MIPSTEDITYQSPKQVEAEIARPGTHLIDVRTEQAYAERHIAQAVNYCVYENDFINKIQSFEVRTAAPIIVYGQGGAYIAAERAAEVLKSAGYTQVSVLKGGLDQWLTEGKATATASPPPPAQSPIKHRCRLDLKQSKVFWSGRNRTNQHFGTIGLKAGTFEFDSEGRPFRAYATVDMRQLECTDIQDSTLCGALIAHLKHSDFFYVDQHATARIDLNHFQPIENAPTSQPNYTATGILQLRGVSQSIEVALLIEQYDNQIIAQCDMQIDRTQHEAIYGSARFFERLGMHLVNDLVQIQALLVYEPEVVL